MDLQPTKHFHFLLPLGRGVNFLDDGRSDEYCGEGRCERGNVELGFEGGDLGAKVVSCCADGETTYEGLAVFLWICRLFREEN